MQAIATYQAFGFGMHYANHARVRLGAFLHPVTAPTDCAMSAFNATK